MEVLKQQYDEEYYGEEYYGEEGDYGEEIEEGKNEIKGRSYS